MNYYKKNLLPENLSSLNDIKIDNDETINELITYLIKSNKINKKKINQLFLKYFDQKINVKIRKNYTSLISKFLNQLLPILLNQNHPKQATFQLLRFLDQISPNFEYLEKLLQKQFIYKNLTEVLSFSGHITNLLAKDEKLLEILDPYYSFRLNGNITIYTNAFEKIQYSLDKEEIILNKLRKLHRYLKFQIITSVITSELKIENASYELSLLARATLEKTIEIAYYLINKKMKFKENFLDQIGLLAYGRLANNTLTANSDLDLVFIYPNQNSNFSNLQEYIKFYKNFSKKIINMLSAKTSEGILYEVDTKLNPSFNKNDLCCKISDFLNFHEKHSYAWEKIALKKSDVVFKNSKFQISLDHLVKKIKLKKINIHDLLSEIKSMRGIKSNNEKNNFLKIKEKKTKLINWYETKYSLGGQRDIEFLEYLYTSKQVNGKIDNLNEKKLFVKTSKQFYYIIDQFINVTFSSEKPESLPNKVVKHLTQYLNVKDLGNLKKMTRFRKNEVNKYLNEIFKNILHK